MRVCANFPGLNHIELRTWLRIHASRHRDQPVDPRSRGGAGGAAIHRRLRHLLVSRKPDELRVELLELELAGELPEVYALICHAALAIASRSADAATYLEMAGSVAATPHERALVVEQRAAYDLALGDPVAAAERCLAGLADGRQTEGLWLQLLIALHRLGEAEAIDAALGGLARLSTRDTAELVRLLSSEPELQPVRARPAYAPLRERHAAT